MRFSFILHTTAYSKLIFFIKTFEVSRVIRELALLKLLIQNISLLYAEQKIIEFSYKKE